MGCGAGIVENPGVPVYHLGLEDRVQSILARVFRPIADV